MEFRLRKWRYEDAESIAAHANNPHIAQYLRDAFPYPYAEKDARAYIRKCMECDEDKMLCLAIDIDGKACGSIGVFVKEDIYRKSAELGYWLGEPFWGNKIMSRAVSEICSLAFSRLNVVRLFAEPFACNAASRKVLENAGFRLEAQLEKSIYKNGRLGDSCIYTLIRNERE